MPTKEEMGTMWAVIWKVNQALVPMLVAWGVWVTVQQFADIEHRNLPHPRVPVEQGELVEMKILMIRIEEQLKYLRADMEQVKKGLSERL